MTENSDWLYEYMVKFMQSPGWRNPILAFIDQYCCLFEDQEENKFMYTDLHTKFKDLIDDLLQNLCSTLGVSSEQFVKTCDKGRKHPKDKKFFQQIFACDNFSSFKKLMLARNKELEKEKEKIEIKQIEKKKTKVFITEEEEKKRREQGFAVKLSKEVFKGFLKEMKKTKNEQKKKENSWKVEKKQVLAQPEENKFGLGFIQSLGQAIENLEGTENDRIDLKSKLNKIHAKKIPGFQETEKTEQGVNWEVNHESLEQKRLTLKEEEMRLNLEKLRLIEEAKRIEIEKQELEEKQKKIIKKKLSQKQNSMENVILAVEENTEQKYFNEVEGGNDRVIGGSVEEFSFSEPVNQNILDEKKVKVSKLEARFLSYLTVPNPCQKLD